MVRSKCPFILTVALLTFGCGDGPGEMSDLVGKCWTKDGWARWSGSCAFGKAQGQGTATYQNSHLKSVRGHFDAGVANGQVAITYSDGATYVGGVKSGEPEGIGVWKQAWGEGYEGPWFEGFYHGDGTYLTADGRRIRAAWDRGQLLGSWYSDNKNGCQVWWSASPDPLGQLTWNGACRNGKAHGVGTIEWIDTESPVLVKVAVSFRGTLVNGKLNGPGVWRQILTFKNVIHRETREGSWVDGMMSGPGRYVRLSEFLDGSFATDRYHGDFKSDLYSGTGRREILKIQTGGAREWTTEEGEFQRGSLTGQGIRTWLRQAAAGETFEQTIGRHRVREFVGFGKRIVRNRVDKGYLSSVVEYASEIAVGGEGVTLFPDGDVFRGAFDAMGSPTRGICIFNSKSYSGPCSRVRTDLSDYQWKVCLSPPTAPSRCLEEIGSYVSTDR